MNRSSFGRRALTAIGALSLLCSVSTMALAGGPDIVAGPSAEPNCYVPWSAQTKFFKYPAKPGPYRIALSRQIDRSFIVDSIAIVIL